jgi:hypothetical protein
MRISDIFLAPVERFLNHPAGMPKLSDAFQAYEWKENPS